MRIYALVMSTQSYIRWMGHAFFEVRVGGKLILIDPWVSNPTSPITLSEIRSADFVLVTHDHFDHLGETVDIAKRTNATVVGIYELTVHLNEQGVKNTIGMNIGGTVKLSSEVEVHMTPAAHSTQRGSPVGYIIRAPEGTIYHAGDTGIYSEMEMLSRLFRIDLALLPIGGHFTMDPRLAAYAVTLLRPRAVVPMHYNTFPEIRQDPNSFKELVESLVPDVKVYIMKPGDTLNLPIR